MAKCICPKCGGNQALIVDVRLRDGAVRRRRECNTCKYRWNTIEVLADDWNENDRRFTPEERKLIFKFCQSIPLWALSADGRKVVSALWRRVK